MHEAVYREWGTDEAPLTIAVPDTYGRRSANKKVLPQREALQKNRRIFCDLMARTRDLKIGRHRFIGGIDPVCTGADPEFSAKNMSMLSEVGDGCWIFFEGPSYGNLTVVTHYRKEPIVGSNRYFRWFKRANRDIRKRHFVLQYQPRKEPDTWANMPR